MAAATGEEGFELARKHVPALVLLDMMLPDVSGLKICRRIKHERALADVSVVLCSGEAVSQQGVIVNSLRP
jgi:two-component system NtrC family sensor kinase